MNWEEEFKERFTNGYDEHKTMSVVRTVDVIEFIESLLKQQREICAEAYRSSMPSTDFTLDLSSISNAPEPE